ncbi:MAG: hypothetical protein Q8P76_03760 [bacterium]|nr:hypothetical protein [bacterium]
MNKQATFKLSGTLLLLIALGLAGYAFWFLGLRLWAVYGPSDGQPATTQFNLEQVSELKK